MAERMDRSRPARYVQEAASPYVHMVGGRYLYVPKCDCAHMRVIQCVHITDPLPLAMTNYFIVFHWLRRWPAFPA